MAHESLRVTVSGAFVGLTSLGWLWLLFSSSGWLKKVSMYYSLDATLWSVTSSEGVASMGVGAVIGIIKPETERFLQNMHKRDFGLQEFREYMCQFPNVPNLGNICHIWNQIQTASWVMILMVLLTIVIFAIGGGLDCYYHFGQARTKTRKYVRLLYSVAPLMFMLALTQYWFFCSALGQMPPVMQADVLGPNVTIAFLLCLLSGVPLVCHTTLGKVGIEEELNEHMSEQRKFNREQGFNNADYGSSLEATVPPQGGGSASGWNDQQQQQQQQQIQMQQQMQVQQQQQFQQQQQQQFQMQQQQGFQMQQVQMQPQQQPFFGGPQSAAGVQAAGHANAAGLWR